MIPSTTWRQAAEAIGKTDPASAYLIHRDLLREGGPGLEALRLASVGGDLARRLLAELEAWPGKPLASHKSAEQLFHKLALAAEIGLRRGDPGIEAIAAKVMAGRSPEGPFTLPMRIGAAYGGTGEETGAWALCDAPVILRALLRLGCGDSPEVLAAVDFLAALAFPEGTAKGWPCAVSASLGGWRGPGKKGDPCPYATLVMLELLLELPEARRKAEGARIERGADCLLELWEKSLESHPYIFYMGNDFRKLKAPLVWYDLLHVLDALSRIVALQGRGEKGSLGARILADARFGEMLDLVEGKADAAGLFTPESVYLAYKDRDFGQKKSPSALLSALALRILGRAERLG